MTTWSNVEFADDYWQSPAPKQNKHVAVNGAFEQSLDASVDVYVEGDAHTDVHAWYYGTIDQSATSDGTVLIPSSWYGETAALPARDKTGFYFTSIIGGTRAASGIGTDFGGSGSRVDPGAVAGPTTVQGGRSLDIHFTEADRGGDSKAVIFLDPDEDPLNHNTVQVFAHRNLGKTASPTRAAMKLDTSGVVPGEYYVGVQIIGADGLTRYDYAAQPVAIT
jgi:hypothetical protein